MGQANPALLSGRCPVPSHTSPICAPSPAEMGPSADLSSPAAWSPNAQPSSPFPELPGWPRFLSLPLGELWVSEDPPACLLPQLRCLVLPAVQCLKSVILQGFVPLFQLFVQKGKFSPCYSISVGSRDFHAGEKTRLCHPEERDQQPWPGSGPAVTVNGTRPRGSQDGQEWLPTDFLGSKSGHSGPRWDWPEACAHHGAHGHSPVPPACSVRI